MAGREDLKTVTWRRSINDTNSISIYAVYMCRKRGVGGVSANRRSKLYTRMTRFLCGVNTMKGKQDLRGQYGTLIFTWIHPANCSISHFHLRFPMNCEPRMCSVEKMVSLMLIKKRGMLSGPLPLINKWKTEILMSWRSLPILSSFFLPKHW